MSHYLLTRQPLSYYLNSGEVTVRMMEETENKDAGPRFLLELVSSNSV